MEIKNGLGDKAWEALLDGTLGDAGMNLTHRDLMLLDQEIKQKKDEEE